MQYQTRVQPRGPDFENNAATVCAVEPHIGKFVQIDEQSRRVKKKVQYT